MQTLGKKIIEELKSGTAEEETIQDLLKDFFSPAFTSTSLNESTLEYYGHFVSTFFRTAVSSIVSSGATPFLVASVDLIYPYCRHFRTHIKVNDPVFLPKAFHLLLLNITKTVDYVDHILKFASYLYAELQLVSSENNIDVFTNPAILWNFAGKLEKQPTFADFTFSFRIRHMSLKLLALKPKNLPSLVTKLDSAVLRFRQRVSASFPDKLGATNLESASVWNNIIEMVSLSIANEDKPKEYFFSLQELHVYHGRFVSFYNGSHSDSLKSFRCLRSLLDKHIDDDNEYTKNLFEVCDAIIFIGDTSKKTLKSIGSMFDQVDSASAKLASSVDKDVLTFEQVSLICETCGIFIEALFQYESFKENKLKTCHLKVIISILENCIKMMHGYYDLQKKNPNENKDKIIRQDVHLCKSYSIFMDILSTLSETDDSDKWLLKTADVVKNYISDVQSLSETPDKTKKKHMVYIGQRLMICGHFCYNQSHNEAGVAIYQILLEQMKLQESSEEFNEQNYIKAHKYLAECQKRIGDWDGAFKTIMSCLLIASAPALSSAVNIWLRVKKEAVKDLPDLCKKTLHDLIKDNKSVIGKAEIDIAAILQLEWESIQSSSNFFPKKNTDYAVALLTDLADLSSDPFVKSRYLYELVVILWNVPESTSKSGKDYLMEAIHLMERDLKSAQSRDKFLLGQAYLLLYTLEQEEFNSKKFQYEKLTNNPEVNTEKTKQFTLQIELIPMEKLDLSLELFEEAASIGDEMCKDMVPADIVSLVYSILFAASVYTVSLKPLSAVKALTVAIEVSQLTDNSELKLKVHCQICSTLSSLGYTALVKSLMDTDLNLPQDSTATYSEKMSLLGKTLTQAELLAEKGEVRKSSRLIHDVLSDCILASSKSKSSCAILGWAKRLLSKLKLMPQHASDSSVDPNCEEETPLDLAYEAMRMYTALMYCIVQPDAPNSKSLGGAKFDVEKYEIVSEVLKSLLYLSQLYCHVGVEREAKCYIKEGLRLAEIFVLPRWAATFYLQLVRISFLSGKRSDIIKAKYEAQLMLLIGDKNKKEIPEDSPCPQAEENLCTPKNQIAKSPVDKFRWSAECSDEESILKADTFSDHTPLSKHALPQIVTTPTSTLNCPESPVHSQKCLCPKCQDVVTLELQLKCRMMSGELDYAFGHQPFPENLLSDTEAIYHELSSLIKTNLEHTLLNKVLSTFRKKKGFPREIKMTSEQSVHLQNCCSDLARIYLIRAQIFEQEGKFQNAFNSAKKGLALLANVVGCNNSEVFTLQAGLILSLANTIPSVVDHIDIGQLLKPNSSLDILSYQLSNMSLNPDIQRSSTSHLADDTKDLLDSCPANITTMSIVEDLPKRRIPKKAGTKKKLIAEVEIKSLASVNETNLPSAKQNELNLLEEESSQTNILSSRLSDISLSADIQCSSTSHLVNDTKDPLESCLTNITTMSIVEDLPKRRIPKKAGTKKKLTAEVEIKSLESVHEVNSPFAKQNELNLLEEESSLTNSLRVCSDITKESPSHKIVVLDVKSKPTIKTKVVRNTRRVPRVSNKAKEILSKMDNEIEMGRECSIDDAGDDCKIRNFDAIVAQEIEKEPEKIEVLESKLESLEKSNVIKDFKDPLCNTRTEAVPIEEIKSTCVTTKVPKNVKATKTRAKRCVKNNLSDSKTDENKSPILNENKQSPYEKVKRNTKKTTRLTKQNTRNSTLKLSETISPNLLDNQCKKMKSPESRILKSRNNDANDAIKKNEHEEFDIYDFDEIDKELPIKKVGRRKTAAKAKCTGWQSKLMEASNRIGRETRREASSPLEKSFSLSPVSLTPVFHLNENLGLISLADADSSSPSSDDDEMSSPYFSLEDIKAEIKDWQPFSNDLLELSSPELLRAAKSDCGKGRKTTRRGQVKTSVKDEKEKTLTDCQDQNDDSFRCHERLKSLEFAYTQMQLFPPCSLYNYTCKALAMNYLPQNPEMAAFYLTEAQAVTLRHVLISQLSRKIRKLTKDQNSTESQKKSHFSIQNAPSIETLKQAKEALSFGQKPTNINSLIDAIHPDWTVCHMSVIATPDFSSPPMLVVTQYRHNTAPTIVSLAAYSHKEGSEILKLYESIQIGNRKSLSLLNKNEWWNARHNLDNKMQDVLNQMEQHWLGCWKGILLAHFTNEDDRKKLKSSAEKICHIIKEKCSKQANLQLVQILIDSSEYLSNDELDMAITQVTGLDDAQCTDFISIKSQILQQCKSINSSVSDRHPLIIILDKVVQHLPWENLPILRNKPVSRMPSLYYLKVQMSYFHHRNSVITDGFDPQSTFYVLNPDDNLPCTQEIFQKSFETTEGWDGVVGKPPTADQFISALTQNDIMIYCGHGSGNKYLHGDHLQQLNCRAAALLMGCSSGQMEAKGVLDETGMINNYYLAFCPVIVANLWDVTDRDIDRFLQNLLDNWILSKDHSKMSLTEAVVKARSVCKLSYLIGCAPVVYGIPL